MYLTKIDIQDFQGIKRLALTLEPFTLVCGYNWSGKTSLQQAVRAALVGEIARVDLQKEYKALIREGAKRAHISAVWKGEDWKVEIGRQSSTLPTAEAIHPALLDQHYLSSLKANDRRVALMQLLEVKIFPDILLERIKVCGGNPELAEQVMPLASVGFAPMVKHCEQRASDARAAWKEITGETYGSEKGEAWKANKEPLDADEREALMTIDHRRALIDLAQDQLSDFEPNVITMRDQLRLAGAQIACPHCGGIYNAISKEKITEIRTSLPEYEKSLTVLRTALENRRRDYRFAEDAKIKSATREKAALERTELAAVQHKLAEEWSALKGLLAPDGIPGEMLHEALLPVNHRLRTTANKGWGQVSVDPDCLVRLNNRLYGLLSEAEQWIADAMFIEALCYVTGHKFLMLDRLDVLDTPKRGEVVAWLRELVRVHDYQVLAFATLKKAPTLEGARVVWLDAGEERAELKPLEETQA